MDLILIQINEFRYVYVGDKIYSFDTNEKILDYISPMGRNDVPYPVAYGENNIYFMLDHKFIHKSELKTPVTVENSMSLYGEFYGHIGGETHKA